jgi:hypothetical protein
MVGFRVFDVGLLILVMLWFFKLRDDDDDPDEDPGGGGGGRGPHGGDDPPKGGGGLRTELPSLKRRLRTHTTATSFKRRRGAEGIPQPLPTRVRRPATPTPARRS